MHDYPGIENPMKIHSSPGPDVQSTKNYIPDDISIREFIELLKEQGLETDAQLLSDIFEEMNGMDEQLSDFCEKIKKLQSEVEQQHGEMHLPDYLKNEFLSHTTQMYLQLDELSRHFLDTKDRLFTMAREGVHQFTEVGKSSLHMACASMCDAGIRYFEGVMMGSHKSMENNENILKHLDELKNSAKDTRLKRGNLVRAIFRRPDIAQTGERESVLLHSIRSFAENGVRFHDTKLKFSAELINKLESVREKQLAASKNKPSFEDLLSNAKSRAEQFRDNMKDKLKEQSHSDHSR